MKEQNSLQGKNNCPGICSDGERAASDHGVLFQNAEGNINMGFHFDDPDIEKVDMCFYNTLSGEMNKSVANNEGLIAIDEKLQTRSCCVELIRKSRILSDYFQVQSFLSLAFHT